MTMSQWLVNYKVNKAIKPEIIVTLRSQKWVKKAESICCHYTTACYVPNGKCTPITSLLIKKIETNTMKYVWIESNCVNDWRYDSCFDSVWMNWCISQKIMCAVGTHAFYVIERAKKTHYKAVANVLLLQMFMCARALCN